MNDILIVDKYWLNLDFFHKVFGLKIYRKTETLTIDDDLELIDTLLKLNINKDEIMNFVESSDTGISNIIVLSRLTQIIHLRIIKIT